MYVDYQEGTDGNWKQRILFSVLELSYLVQSNMMPMTMKQPEQLQEVMFGKTGTNAGTLQIESNWVGFNLNLTLTVVMLLLKAQ